jgi:hypothetical protein
MSESLLVKMLNERLAAEIALGDDLAKELSVAREAVENWASYADAYFKEKWDLAGDLARIDAARNRYLDARIDDDD